MANYDNSQYSYADVLNNKGYYMKDDLLRYSAGVQTMQQKFNSAGYSCGTADGKFGAGTDKVVREFQADQFITVDGKAGKGTLTLLDNGYDNSRYTYDYVLSSTSAYYARDTKLRFSAGVQTMQTKLRAAGYTCDADGKFGAGTASAVKSFQSARGLTVDGRAGKNTLLALGNSSSGGNVGGVGDVFASVAMTNSTLTDAQMKKNAKYVYSYLQNQGFSKQAACAVIGNMQKESDVDPGVWQSMNDVTLGYGLLQWDDATKFLNDAVANGRLANANPETANSLARSNPKALMDAELDFFIRSCAPGAGNFFYPAASMQHTGYNMIFSNFKVSTMDVETLAIVFHDHYERSRDGSAALNERKKYAADWFSYL